MKKLSLKVLTAVLLLCSSLICLQLQVTKALASGATLSLSPSVGTFNKGCSFSVDIKVNTEGALTDGTDAVLLYDTTRFKAVNIKNGTIYADYSGTNIDSQRGRILISGLSSVNSPFSGSGNLATINFLVLDTAPVGLGQIKFDFDPQNPTKTTDSNVVQRGLGSDILSQVVDGNYSLGSGSCNNSLPTASPSSFIGGDLATSPTTIPDQLPKAGDFQDTLVLTAIGGFLVIIGLLGLLLL
jgi:hypothetical protein